MITLLILLAGLQVHEWGVIMSSPASSITSVTPSELEEITTTDFPYGLEDKAPVMYFHGDTCSVNIRVSLPDRGYLTTIIPEADEGGVSSTYMLWDNLQLSNSTPGNMQEGWEYCDELNYNIETWRNVNALTVINNERYDKFVYYDCVPENSGDLPFISQSGNQSFRMPYGEIPCIVLTSVGGRLMYGSFTLADILTSIPKGLQFLDDVNILKREIWKLSEETLYEDEFDAFWNCWETELITAPFSNVIVLYKVPDDIINEMVNLEVIPDREMEVEINRFILAVLPYRTE